MLRVPGSVRLLLLAVVAAAIVLVPAAGASRTSHPRGVYSGLGTWASIYSKEVWADPEGQVAAMADDGVRTLYVETGNYRQSGDLVRPWDLGRIVDSAHADGMRVVAWYLPSFLHLNRDKRRVTAAIRFRSPLGARFDGFALDIEATNVRGIPLRNRRLLQLSAWLRRTAGPRYPLGAITPSPIGMSPSYWPNIPYRELSRDYDVFMPMAYSTLRGVHGRDLTRRYLTATVAAIRASAGRPRLPVHLIGGLSGGMRAKELAGFMRAVAESRVLGYSLYAFTGTSPAAWRALTTRR